MITCDFRGQMANQMFIAATVIAHALRNNTAYSFPERSGKRRQFPFMFPELPKLKQDVSGFEVYKEQQFGVYNPLPDRDDLIIQGYFQSEKYFKDYRKEIIAAFDIPKFTFQKGIVSVHVRRGDYVQLAHKHPPVTIEYLLQAMNQFDESYRFMFFSDDMHWCKANFKGNRFMFSEGLSAKYDLGRMAANEHCIIANSTYSWWGAWLNENPHKKIIAPSQWFGPKYQDIRLMTTDIIPDTWIKI